MVKYISKTSLFREVCKCEEKTVQDLINNGADVNAIDEDGGTPLFYAVWNENENIIQELVKCGADINASDNDGKTALFYAVWRENESMVEKLINNGADITASDKKGRSSLHYAVWKEKERMVKKLIDCGADINATDEDGKTALFFAVEKGNEKIVDKLIKLGADINATNKNGRTVLFFAVWNENEKMVEKLIKFGADVHAANKYGKTALFYAVDKENKNIIRKLIKCGADVNAIDKDGRSPLFYAVQNNNESVVRALIDAGADVNLTDNDDKTVLFYAVEKRYEKIVDKLIKGGVDINATNKNGRTVLLFAVLNENEKMVEKLINCGADVNAIDKDGRSPLFYAVEALKSLSIEEIKTTVHWSMIKLLRSHGADYRITDGENQSCLDIAWEFPAIKELLKGPIDLDRFPVRIKPWKSVSKKHERCLAEVARHLESEHLESYWYHKDQLASGSFGDVFAAMNEKDGREVAIKRMVKKSIVRPEDKREIQNLTALADCEQVVLYVHYFEDKNFSYIVLELAEGNLDELLDYTITEDIRIELCQDVVKGLVYLHNQNILHRDLKATNILYKWHPKLCLKIADFGLSRRIDSTSTTVYGTNAGTRCWIAPEVLTSTKPHSKSSDMFACGLVLHYILSVKTHPFAPRIRALQHETEANILNGNMEGWDDSLSPEAAHLVKAMLDGDESERPSADKALDHPFFWSKKKKVDLLNAVGNQHEFGFPRAKRTLPLTAVETDLETSFGTIVKYVDWNDPGYVHMTAIYTEMTRKRKYDINSVVELVRFIRNAYAHVAALPKLIQDQLLKHYVFLEYFPNLVMEVYKAVTTHGWDQTREEIEHALR